MVNHLSIGKNEIQVKCIDTNNASFAQHIIVDRKAMDFSAYKHLLRLKIKPFKKQKKQLLSNLEQKISQCMQERQRFRVFPQNSKSPVDCMLEGRTHLQNNSLELAVELFDIETLDVIIAANAYIENMNQYPDKLLTSISKNINARLADAYPILSGNIVGIENNRMIAKVKYHHQVRNHMKIVLCDRFTENGHCLDSPPCFGRIIKKKNGDLFVNCDTIYSSGVFLTR